MKSLLPQSTLFSSGTISLSLLPKFAGGAAGAAVVRLVVDLLVVVVRLVVVRLVVEVEASGTHCPGTGFEVVGPELPSAGVLGGLAHSGCGKNKYEVKIYFQLYHLQLLDNMGRTRDGN